MGTSLLADIAAAVTSPPPTLQNMATGAGNIFATLSEAGKKKIKSSKGPKAPREEPKPKECKHAEVERAIFSRPSGVGLGGRWADDSEDEEDFHQPLAAAQSDGWEEVRCHRHRCPINRAPEICRTQQHSWVCAPAPTRRHAAASGRATLAAALSRASSSRRRMRSQ